MEPVRVKLALRGRLGDAGALALEEMFDEAGHRWRDDMLAIAEERFERKLTSEIGLLRADLTSAICSFQQDVVRELATTRAEMIKWSFLFWAGQAAVMGALLGLALRFLGHP